MSAKLNGQCLGVNAFFNCLLDCVTCGDRVRLRAPSEELHFTTLKGLKGT